MKPAKAVTAAVDAVWRTYAEKLRADLPPAIDILRRWKLASDAGGEYQQWKYVVSDLLDYDDQTANQILADMAAALDIPGEPLPTAFTGVTGIPAPPAPLAGTTPQTMVERELHQVQMAAELRKTMAEMREEILRLNPPPPVVPADRGGSGWSYAEGKGYTEGPKASDFAEAVYDQVAGRIGLTVPGL